MAAPPPRTPLVGRQRELALLLDRLAAAGAGHGSIVLVSGEPGIGKSRLLAELAVQARSTGWTVLTGRAYETEGMPPYQPIVEALREYVRECSTDRLLASLGRNAAAVALLLPELHDLLSDLPASPPLRPDQERQRLLEGISDTLRGIAHAGEGGLVLLLDDLHWADAPSLQVLQQVSRRLAGVPMLVVVAYRSVAAEPSQDFTATLALLAREVAPASLTLVPLSIDETSTLAESIADTVVAQPVAEAIQRVTEGNPFFVCEVVRNFLAERRDLSDPGAASDDLVVPELVRQVIAARLGRLRSTTVQLLRQGAILGDGFAFDVVAAASGLDVETALDAIDEALAAGMVQAEGDSYHFAHALIRRTLDDGLSPARRQHLHLLAAQAIEQVYARALSPHVATLAHHYRLAGPTVAPEKVIDYAVRAGEAARAVFAYEDAVAHWQTALTVLEALPAPLGQRAELLERIGELLYLTDHDRATGLAYLERSLALYEQDVQEEAAARLHVRIARHINSNMATRDVARVLDHYRAAEAYFGREDDRVELVELYLGHAEAANYGVHPHEAARAARRAIEIAERIGETALATRATNILSNQIFALGQVAEGLALTEHAYETADRLDDAVVAHWCAMGHALFTERFLADHEDSRRWWEREAAKPRLAQASHLQRGSRWGLSQVHYHNGDLAEARRAAPIPEPPFEPRVAMWEGDWERAVARGMAVREQLFRAGDRFNGYWNNQALAMTYRLRGEYEQAEAITDECIALGVDGPQIPMELASRAMMALLLAETDRALDAHSHLDRCRTILAEGADWRGVAGRVAFAEAVTAAAAGRITAAQPLFEQSLATFQQYNLYWDETDALVTWGSVLLRAGRAGEGNTMLDEARSRYERKGAAAAWLERIERLRATGDRVRPARNQSVAVPVYPDGLTPREVELLRLLAAGMTNREIADTLVISLNTVERHVNHILQKTGATNRAQAVTYAHQHALL